MTCSKLHSDEMGGAEVKGFCVLCLSYIAGCYVFAVAFDSSSFSLCFVTQRSSLLRLESDSAYPDRGLLKEFRICLEIWGN